MIANTEVEQPEAQEEAPPQKRPRGRPRKDNLPPKEPTPRPPKQTKEEKQAYFQRYYLEKMHKHRDECVCKNCQKSFTTEYALRQHQRESTTCLAIRVVKVSPENFLAELRRDIQAGKV